MTRSVEAEDIRNELGWWSSWTDTFKMSPETYGVVSDVFQEPLFNRIVFAGPPRDPNTAVPKLVMGYSRKGSTPSFFVFEGEEYAETREAIVADGFRVEDRLLVMESAVSVPVKNKGVEVRKVTGKDAEVWSRAYLEAFYEDLELLPEVVRCVESAIKSSSNRLLLASVDERVAGTMALHSAGGLTGLYCLGTVPVMRSKGAAAALLRYARDFTSRRKKRLVLQVFESGGVEAFYLERGYRRLTAELVLVRK